MRLYHILLVALSMACGAGSQPEIPMVFDNDSLLRHRVEGEREVTVSSEDAAMIGIPILVTISPQGEVTRAEPDELVATLGVDASAALAAARQWRFRPFLYRGMPVVAQGVIEIGYRAPGLWRDPQAPMPPIDYSSLRIRLTRSACFGSCPDYAVEIDGAGTVFFSTREESLAGAAEAHREFSHGRGVLLPGHHRAQIDRQALDALIERFRQAHFFGLRREYIAGITDNPTYELSFETGDRSWTVTDYVGREAGMPDAVTALEEAVDAAAGTGRWVHGDAASVASLRSEGFDFGSDRAMALAVAAFDLGYGASQTSDRFFIDLIEAGLPLDRRYDNGGMQFGEWMLIAAVRHHRMQLFQYLAEHGWLARSGRSRLSQAFAEGGGGCYPEIASALVRAGADPMTRTPRRRDPDFEEAGGATALIFALHRGVCDDLAKGPIVAGLLASGVDINAADEAGKTALFGVEDPELQDQLLSAGAQATVRDHEGNSPAFSSWNDRIVLALLEAGADPRGHYYDGKTLREQARERHMPSVLAWLDAHGIR